MDIDSAKLRKSVTWPRASEKVRYPKMTITSHCLGPLSVSLFDVSVRS